MEIEAVFSSKPRMKILKLIARLGALNVSDIARRIKLELHDNKPASENVGG